MNAPWIYLLIGLAVVALALLAYWQLVIAEGTYLGPRIVALLYDWAAPAYERIKRFSEDDEQWFLGLPLARALAPVANPLVLDVGTGTGRLPRALLFQPAFHGRVIGVDLSRRMLAHAMKASRPYAGRVTLIWQDAQTLPFLDDTFDAVTCLEVLEFTPNPKAVLEELIRVLRPGGVLLVTNRVGPDARLLPGKALPKPDFAEFLKSLPLEEIRVRSWQLDYNLAWALKAGIARGGGVHPLPQILRCPTCGHNPLPMEQGAYTCTGCGRAYPMAKDGIIDMARRSRRRPNNRSV